MTAESVTLHRSEPAGYQLTIWADGVARWDGEHNVSRHGAWQAALPASWFDYLCPLLNEITPASRSAAAPTITVVVEHHDGRQVRTTGNPTRCGRALWTVITLLEGIAAQAAWEPIGSQDPEPGAVLVHLHHRTLTATAHWRPGGRTTVLPRLGRGSAEAPSLTREYRRSRTELLERGVLLPNGQTLTFTHDHEFGSPSAAALGHLRSQHQRPHRLAPRERGTGQPAAVIRPGWGDP